MFNYHIPLIIAVILCLLCILIGFGIGTFIICPPKEMTDGDLVIEVDKQSNQINMYLALNTSPVQIIREYHTGDLAHLRMLIKDV